MRPTSGWIAVCLVPWWLGSCGLIHNKRASARSEKEKAEAAEAAAAMPAGLVRSRDGGTSSGATARVTDSEGGSTVAGVPALAPDAKIVWTDPDNPDAEIPELDTILKQPVRGPWEQSETVAAKRAEREGKCLLIWFTDAQHSPTCKMLSGELFSLPEYEKWAAEHFVSLRVDANVAERDPDKRARLLDYIEVLRKRHKVAGYPMVVVCAPQGEVIARYRGYSHGQSEFFWGRLKSAELLGNKSWQSWRTGLEKHGYREWSDRHDRKVFARLTGYKDGELWLVEPDGTRAKTNERKLSDADRQWIAEQKKARGMP